ncbi:hypothetical protein GCM10020221_08830 [Streptomyces thioluteus]|uniref:Uncharacterized protein n=1 Tax=Streptomyces thioluteus TaxID=66431 RepID=A0ABN3WI33_STRTU
MPTVFVERVDPGAREGVDRQPAQDRGERRRRVLKTDHGAVAGGHEVDLPELGPGGRGRGVQSGTGGRGLGIGARGGRRADGDRGARGEGDTGPRQ